MKLYLVVDHAIETNFYSWPVFGTKQEAAWFKALKEREREDIGIPFGTYAVYELKAGEEPRYLDAISLNEPD